jgi:hypothetical protein
MLLNNEGRAMKRRELLFGGAVAVGASAAEAGTKDAAAPPVVYDAVAVEAAIASIDKRMADLAQVDLRAGAAKPKTAEEAEVLDARIGSARAALRSLYFLGAFTELAEHERAHPGVQARMLRMQSEMDEAVEGMAGFLESLTPEDHRRLQGALKSDPGLGMRIGEYMEQVAKEDGFGYARRADLRLAVDDYTRRMKTQNPALVLDPLVRKTRKIQANLGTAEEHEAQLSGRMGEKAFWEFQQRVHRDLKAWDVIYVSRPRVDLVALAEYAEQKEPPENPRLKSPKTVLKVGGIILGVGFGTAALGGIAYLIGSALGTASSAQGVFYGVALVLGVTVGPALVVGGLVTLIVGGIMYAVRANQAPEPEDEQQPEEQREQAPPPPASDIPPPPPAEEKRDAPAGPPVGPQL